jgi:uncharacterized protein involved in exopolysaccharide biosynthesis
MNPGATPGAPAWLTITLALIGTGGLLYLRDAIKFLAQKFRQTAPERRVQREVHAAVAQYDASLLAVAKSRDELAEDNQRLRDELREQTARHATDRAEWAKERAELRREIEAMETRLRTALDDLGALKVRHSLT